MLLKNGLRVMLLKSGFSQFGCCEGFKLTEMGFGE